MGNESIIQIAYYREYKLNFARGQNLIVVRLFNFTDFKIVINNSRSLFVSNSFLGFLLIFDRHVGSSQLLRTGDFLIIDN